MPGACLRTVTVGVLLALACLWLPTAHLAHADPGLCPPLPLSDTDPLFVDAPAGSVISLVCVEPSRQPSQHFGPFASDGTYGNGCFILRGLQTAAATVGEVRRADCRGTTVRYAIGPAPPLPTGPAPFVRPTVPLQPKRQTLLWHLTPIARTNLSALSLLLVVLGGAGLWLWARGDTSHRR